MPAKAIHFSADFYVHFGRRLCEMAVFVRQYIKIGAAVVDSWSLVQFICLNLCICIMSNTIQSSVFCSDIRCCGRKPSCVLASNDKNSFDQISLGELYNPCTDVSEGVCDHPLIANVKFPV